jgi:aminomethyltransferase
MLRTALYQTHKRLGARLIDFGGWEMPVMYGGIAEEHVYTRTVSTIFDVSHMGRLVLTGPDAEAVLQYVCTRNVAKLAVGRSGYSHVCNADGGVMDDVIVSRDEKRWIVVCNAGNREKVVAHLLEQLRGRNASLEDTTQQTVMMAVQGPATMRLFAEHMPIKIDEMKRYGFASGKYMGQAYTVFRSGYTGEDGLEIVVSAATGALVWDYLTKDGGQDRPTIKPAGLGARDTLRTEAGMPLYGHELTEQTDPLSAGCGWCVELEKSFIGVEALRRIAADGPRRKITGLILDGRRIARQDSKVYDGEAEVGIVTSGTFAPTLQKSIAMAFIDAPLSKEGQSLEVGIKDGRAPATVVCLPFYKRRF